MTPMVTNAVKLTLTRVPHLRYLDGWRGIAITLVLIGHFTDMPFINMGRLGVELFFALSGRLMAEILFIKNYPLPDFFRRRISRVWPALAVYVLVVGAIYSTPGPFGLSRRDMLFALTFITNYVGAAGHLCYVLNHIWSLCIEEHTYLFLALTAFLARRWNANAVAICLTGAGLCILSGAFQSLILHGTYYSVYWRTDARASSILLSCGFFLALNKNERFYSRCHAYTPLFMGVVGLLLSLNAVPDYIKYSLGAICFAFTICLVDKAPSWILKILNHTLLVQMGIWSFSLYLWQQPFDYNRWFHHHHLFLLIGVFPCALASFYLVEQPARRFLNTHWGKAAAKI